MFDKDKLSQNLPVHIRSQIHGTAERPRLKVFNNSTHIYVQLIDDNKRVTLTAASSPVKYFKTKRDIIASAKLVGTALAKNALANGITEVVFDTSGCIFHGYVLKLAEAAREAGLKF